MVEVCGLPLLYSTNPCSEPSVLSHRSESYFHPISYLCLNQMMPSACSDAGGLLSSVQAEAATEYWKKPLHCYWGHPVVWDDFNQKFLVVPIRCVCCSAWCYPVQLNSRPEPI